MLNKNLLQKKLKFLSGHLNRLTQYKDYTLKQFEKDLEKRKFVEKLIQEVVDCAIDINQHFLEKLVTEKGWTGIHSFRMLDKAILAKYKIQFFDEELNLLSDSVNFRNEIIHSYDVNIYLIWSKRNLSVFINLYKNYLKKILVLLEKLK